ncbi:unnamed protein product [Durusdinium trenchii]|uniref:Uncharacterized protein n=1 Tax=Durusdinium trenchii TaxID=1381693 RepID=A0ABP0N719_9DINO
MTWVEGEKPRGLPQLSFPKKELQLPTRASSGCSLAAPALPRPRSTEWLRGPGVNATWDLQSNISYKRPWKTRCARKRSKGFAKPQVFFTQRSMIYESIAGVVLQSLSQLPEP